MILLGRHLDHLSILIGLVKVLDAGNLGYLALCHNRIAHRLQSFQLYFQEPFDNVIFLDWWNLHSHFYLSFFPLSDLEPHLFKVFKPFIAPHRKNVFIQIIELLVGAFGDDSQHERRIVAGVLEYFVLELDCYIHFLDRTREKGRLTKRNRGTVDVDEILCLSQLSELLLFL